VAEISGRRHLEQLNAQRADELHGLASAHGEIFASH
jgi:hypothetical protein